MGAGLVVSAVSTLVPLAIPYIAKLVEHLFGKGNGPAVKKPVAVGIVTTIAEALAKMGHTGTITQEDISKLIDSVVADLNAKGDWALPTVNVAPTPATPQATATATIATVPTSLFEGIILVHGGTAQWLPRP